MPANPKPLRIAALGLLTLLMLLPVTLPVPVLRGFVLERFDVSDFWASAFMSVNMLGSILGAPFGGLLTDRFGHSRVRTALVLILDGLLMFSLTLSLPFATFLSLRFAEGFFHTVALSMVMAAAADGAPDQHRGRVMGLIGAGLTMGVALGAPLGGRLGDVDPLLPIQVGAALLVFAGLAALVLMLEPARKTGTAGLRTLFKAVLSDPPLRVPMAFAFVDRFTVGFFTTTFPLGMAAAHQMAPSKIGMLLALFLLPFALLSYPFGRYAERQSRTRLVAVGSLTYGVATASLGFWPPSWLPLLMVVLGVTSAVMFVPSLIMTTDLARSSSRGTAIGAFNAAGSLGFVLGPLAGGAISTWIATTHGAASGVTAAFAVAGATELLCVLLTLRAMRRLVQTGRTT